MPPAIYCGLNRSYRNGSECAGVYTFEVDFRLVKHTKVGSRKEAFQTYWQVTLHYHVTFVLLNYW
jgi:hypothetical protein